MIGGALRMREREAGAGAGRWALGRSALGARCAVRGRWALGARALGRLGARRTVRGRWALGGRCAVRTSRKIAKNREIANGTRLFRDAQALKSCPGPPEHGGRGPARRREARPPGGPHGRGLPGAGPRRDPEDAEEGRDALREERRLLHGLAVPLPVFYAI